MEITGSRKRPSKKGDEGGRKSRVRGDGGGGGTATDAEVEEFFAILRRIHAAARYFGKGKTADQEGGSGESNIKSNYGGLSTPYDKDVKRRPSFKWEDFDEEDGLLLRSEEGNGAVSGRAAGKGTPTAVGREADQKAQKRAAKETRLLDYSLDLNTEPEPETHPSC
ncbi:hypothetical protein H6P81_008914 [Aristolochia fimbriata]|uniref:Uncharacterized protein n=1 Tax=Aristolochia fimbriata TaxID=158543 RepID=A0AAV7EJR4_ARIFI|nr:hypothetical protein H6P81_008914 [Aristolochia fimbriata]